MRSIWKFPFEIDDYITIEMPAIADVLCVQTQGYEAGTLASRPYIWALVDVESEPRARNFRLYGTGHNVDHERGRYIGTFQINNGKLVFHLFEVDD